MAVAFTKEQRDEIQCKLIEAGFELSSTIGFKKMTIARITEAAGVSVGSFYIFYDSKESFAKALIGEMEARSMSKLTALLSSGGTITVKEFLDWYRDYYRPENNFLLKIRLEDWIWLKTHITDGTYFESAKDTDRITKILPYITGIRKDIDLGIVINFIKSIYAIYQNRETFFEESLQRNVDLIFDTIYRYVREDDE
ncbi:MAG TPA: hypothetical protein DEO83_05605 [Lachnospiraceae bacterium]|nr:hypothetical protein [Lachnospiraceae bacterium]